MPRRKSKPTRRPGPKPSPTSSRPKTNSSRSRRQTPESSEIFPDRSVRVGSKVVTVCGRVIANVYPNLARQSQQPALIHGIAYPGRLTILAGAPKSGKTAALLALGAAATRGRAPGGTGATCTVLIVQLEETAHETVQKFSAAGGDHKRAIIVPRLGDDRMASLAAEIEVHRPDIMVIDSLSRLNRMVSESSPERITQALEPLQDMARRFQCAVILIHHANKAGTVRGSTAIAAVADIVATISGNHDECMTIIESRGRVAPATLTLRAVDSSRTKFECFLDGDAREAAAVGAREALKDRILGALAAGPLGSADLRALVGGNGVECDRAALELAGANLINRLGPKKPWALVTTQAAAAPLRPAKRRRSVPRPEPRLRRAKSRRE